MQTTCFWFTGLSASGKSTLSELLYNEFLNRNILNVKLLDGEDIRDQLKLNGYKTSDRNEIGITKAKLALDYINKGNHVIITGIAHHKDTREKIRNIFSNYFEIYLKCDVSICSERDYKGNYSRAMNGELPNFVGISEQYEESAPELTIRTDIKSIDDCSIDLYEKVFKFLNNKHPE